MIKRKIQEEAEATVIIAYIFTFFSDIVASIKKHTDNIIVKYEICVITSNKNISTGIITISIIPEIIKVFAISI